MMRHIKDFRGVRHIAESAFYSIDSTPRRPHFPAWRPRFERGPQGRNARDRMMLRQVGCALLAPALLAGCASSGGGGGITKEQGGTVLGALGGAAAGAALGDGKWWAIGAG